MCHVRSDQQEAPAFSLLQWSPLEGEEDPLHHIYTLYQIDSSILDYDKHTCLSLIHI